MCVVPESAITLEQLNAEGAELPWGTAGSGDRSCYESANDGMSESFVEGLVGVGALFTRNPETGEWFDWGSAGSTWVQMAASLGAIAMIGPAIPLLANMAPKGSWAQEFAQDVHDRQVAVVEGFVGSPEDWQENPAKAAGAAFFNIGTLFIPAAGAVGGAAKAGLFGARAASLVEHTSVVLGKGGATVLDAAGGAGTKVGDALAGLMKVDGGSGLRFDKAQAELADALTKADVEVTKPDLTPGGIHGSNVDAPNGGHGGSDKPGAEGPTSEHQGADKPNGSDGPLENPGPDGKSSEHPSSPRAEGDAVPGTHPDQGAPAPGDTTSGDGGAPGKAHGGTGDSPVDSGVADGEGWKKTSVSAEGAPNLQGGDGQAHASYGDSGEYPARPEKIIDEKTGEFVQNPDTALNDKTWDLVSDPNAQYGRHTDGSRLEKFEYDERYVQGNEDNWDRYPSFDGVQPGTRVTYTDPVAFIDEYGLQFDRIGEPGNGEYLGVLEDGKPAAFEARGLPISSLNKNYYGYSFTPDAATRLKADGIQIEISRIAPAFGRESGALQTRLIKLEGDGASVVLKVGYLIKEGYLR